MLRAYDLSDGREPMSYEEIDYLKELASSLPPNPIIFQIGAADGVSTLAFLEARPDAFIFSIDVLECKQEMDNVIKGGHDIKRVVRLLGDSKEIGPMFPYQCDLLFIDGDHWNAMGDIMTWVYTGKVKPGGVIAFHDYIEPPNPPNNPGDVWNQVNKGMADYSILHLRDRIISFRNI